MSGGYYHNSDSRSTGRYDSHYDRDTSLRGSRGRGLYRGGSRPQDHYNTNYNNNYNTNYNYNHNNNHNNNYNNTSRGRGRGFSRQERYYGSRRFGDARDTYRNGDREESPRMSPRDTHYRDHNSRETGREMYVEHANVQENNGRAPLFPGNVDRSGHTEELGPERLLDRVPDRPRSSLRGTSQGSLYGHKRSIDVGQGPHRSSGGITLVNANANANAHPTPSGEKSGDTAPTLKNATTSSYTNPWVSLLKLGEGKTAARLELNHKELEIVNEKLTELQSEKIRLACAVATLEVYAKRDALNTEICSEKLDEFTYL